jgi:hypothetical protein
MPASIRSELCNQLRCAQSLHRHRGTHETYERRRLAFGYYPVRAIRYLQQLPPNFRLRECTRPTRRTYDESIHGSLTLPPERRRLQ